jgi:16S rRNA G966 N2-methylase RsmD
VRTTQGPPYLDPIAQAEQIEAFFALHLKPSSTGGDDFERPPFAADIKEGKSGQIYNTHSYHTKVPPRSIVPYILHYTQPGDIVLDLFCGSGMTGVAAQMCSDPPSDILDSFPELKERVGPRACILGDLSPAACHIAYNYNTPVDVEALKVQLERVRTATKSEIEWLYATEHYEPAAGEYDVRNASVARRLTNPPGDGFIKNLLQEEIPTWELLSRFEVEARLGYPVTDLPWDDRWDGIDIAKIEQWVCIPATIQYAIWSDVYRCEGFVTLEESTGKISVRGKNVGKPIVTRKRVERGCGKPIVLWDAARDHVTGEVDETFKCPYCEQSWIKTQLKRIEAVPVASNYTCDVIGIKKHGPELVHLRQQRKITALEVSRIREIDGSPQPHWVPTEAMDPNGPRYRRSALQVKGIKLVSDFWTKRNLRAFAALWEQAEAIEDPRLSSAVQFLLTSFVARVSRKAEYRVAGGAGNSHNLIIPSITREDNVSKSMAAKEGDILSHFQQLESASPIPLTAVSVGSATCLVGIPSDSVDYIFTDPPFGSNIYYSEPNLLWECWLRRITDAEFEAVVHRENDGGTKRLPDYARLMGKAISEMFRVLKPGRSATIEFNNSDGAVFEVIKMAIRDAGFEISNMLLLDKDQKTFFQFKGATGEVDTVDKDVLFNLRKPSVVLPEVRQEEQDLELQVADAVREHLQTLPERIKTDPSRYNAEHRTTATINSMLMNSLIPRGVSVERLNLPFIERVCARYFRKVGQHWYLRGESVGSGTGQVLFEEEISIKDEVSAIDWLRQKIQQKPMLIGELKPLWMRATGLLPAAVSRELSLDGLLSENFWRDGVTNRWREPSDEEREKMNDDRSIRVLHDADRYIAGLLRRSTADSERCEWIEVLFKACRQVEDGDTQSAPALRGFDAAEAYRVITRLFQSVLRERVSPDAYTRAQKQASVATNRISQSVRDEQELIRNERIKIKGPSLFDGVD